MLAYRLVSQEEEILSVYLCRLALAHGHTPRAFFALHLHLPHFWNQDIDRGMSSAGLAALSSLTGVEAEVLHAMTLASVATALTPVSYATTHPPAVVPWINAIRGRKISGRLPALAFCPDCLASGISPKRTWRFSFSVTCEIHGSPMLCRCEHCGAPFMPILVARKIRFCPHCGADLASQHQLHWRPSRNAPLQLAQRSLSACALRATNGDAAAREHLVGIRALATIYPVWARRGRFMLPPERIEVAGGGRLEVASFDYRCRVLSWIGWLIDDWPTSFRSMTQQLRLTQRPFARAGKLPLWIREEVSRLPPGRTADRFRCIDELANTLTTLSSEKPTNWRSERASVLVQSLKPDERKSDA